MAGISGGCRDASLLGLRHRAMANRLQHCCRDDLIATLGEGAWDLRKLGQPPPNLPLQCRGRSKQRSFQTTAVNVVLS